MTRRSNSKLGRKNSQGTFGRGLESLETRQLYSAVPIDFYSVATASGTQLVAELTAPSQEVSIVRSYDGIKFNVDGTLENVAGDFSYLSVIAQSGNNTIVIGPNMTVPTCLWAGTGNDLLSTGASDDALRAGGGDDTLVALGGVNDKLFAGTGYTNMWATYNNYYYKSTGTLVTHFFQSFLNTSDITLDGNTISEPGTNTSSPFNGTWQNFAFTQPLFSSAGPQFSDVVQGACGDCYYMSGLAAIAYNSPQQIRNSITSLGDGTYAVEFFENGTPVYIREDGYLPVDSYNSTFYAQIPQDGAMWAPLMEKAYAYFSSIEQGYAPSYGIIDEGGNADESLSALLGNSQGSYNLIDKVEDTAIFSNEQIFADWINSELQKGDAVEMGFSNGNSSDFYSIPGLLINDHEYTVLSDTVSNTGAITGFWVRNPWGIDLTDGEGGPAEMAPAGHNDGADNGIVWISVAEAYSVANDVGAASLSA
jgi:hypothetical protein